MQQEINKFNIKTFAVGPMQNLIYIIWDIKTKRAAIIDPAWDLTGPTKYIRENHLILEKIFLTHSHHDHVNAVDHVLEAYDAQIFLNKKEYSFWGKEYDNIQLTGADDIIALGECEIRSIHTPGHTPGSACYNIEGNLIAGDTLFVYGCGRCDLHGGSPEDMYNSLKDLKNNLSDSTLILPGHDYSTKKTSTMSEQIEGNPFFHFNDLDNFIEYRMNIHDKTRPEPYDFIKRKT
ncbi:MAG: MBL fold hydrolase [Gammaproteobacteria bacterium]|nr:MBL fold hydrolase [Gammaproteobacteria bacterium]|tara:strand:- start:172 stop:873 length:702 start_codon:yes stop_codon:yes gene_type:complete